MSNSKKLVYASFTLVAILTVSLLQAFSAYAVELNGKEKALAFLSDVVMLDLSKYNVTLGKYVVTYPTEYGRVPQEEVLYTLQTNQSYLVATVVLRNGTFAYCLLGWHEGSPIYSQPQPTDLVDVAKGVLDRYQVYTGFSRCQPMRNMLGSVIKAENTVVTAGNLRLEVTVNGRSTGFVWRYEGLATEWLSIALQDGALRTINDPWSIFTVDDEAKVTREQAIDIAVNRAQGFSWTVDGVPVGNFTIVRENATATLLLNAREPLTLHAFWRIDLPLDKVYPGGVTFISVGIWADTGAVSYIQELGFGGGVPPPADSSPPPSQPPDSSTPDSTSPPDSTGSNDSATSPDSTSSPTQQPTDTTTPTLNPTTIAATTATIATIVIATTALLLKKKRK